MAAMPTSKEIQKFIESDKFLSYFDLLTHFLDGNISVVDFGKNEYLVKTEDYEIYVDFFDTVDLDETGAEVIEITAMNKANDLVGFVPIRRYEIDPVASLKIALGAIMSLT